jgi:hypothetical protein
MFLASGEYRRIEKDDTIGEMRKQAPIQSRPRICQDMAERTKALKGVGNHALEKLEIVW